MEIQSGEWGEEVSAGRKEEREPDTKDVLSCDLRPWHGRRSDWSMNKEILFMKLTY